MPSEPGVLGRLATSRWANPVLALAAIGLTLVSLEVAARLWVTFRWEPGSRERLIAPVGPKAGYVYDAQTGYRLQPNFRRVDHVGRRFRHDSLGLRGPDISVAKPAGTARVVLLGASTVYGLYVDAEETSAAVLARLLRQRLPAVPVQVLNAGVPGWTSRETLLNLQAHILQLEPDVVVELEGRNEMFPELFENYRPDYSHYRRIGYDYRTGNRVFRRLFRYSWFAMVLTTSHGHRFGYSPAASDPVYGYIDFDNEPTPAEMKAYVTDSTRFAAYRTNVERLVTLAQQHGAAVVLATTPFWAERLRSGVFIGDSASIESAALAVARNNATVRGIARQIPGVRLVDAHSITGPRYLVDDCHFWPAGEEVFAQLLADAIAPLLEPRGAPESGSSEESNAQARPDASSASRMGSDADWRHGPIVAPAPHAWPRHSSH